MNKFGISLLLISFFTLCLLAGCGEGSDTKSGGTFSPIDRDIIPPFVEYTIPADGEINVPEDVRITVRFNEGIKTHLVPSSLLITSDHLEKAELKPNCEYSVISLSAKFSIKFPFRFKPQNDETYTVKLDKSRIIDDAGNRMEQDYKFSFTIEGISPSGKPQVPEGRLSYLVWQDIDGIWHIRWNSDWFWHFAPPSGSSPKPKNKRKPRPAVERTYENQEYLFTGTIISNKEFQRNLVEAVDFEDSDKWDLWSVSMLNAELLQTLTEKNLIPVEVDMRSVDKNVIIFEAETGGVDSGDGLTFKSDGTEFVFELKIDDRYMSDWIFIGKKRKNPREVPFKLKSNIVSKELVP